MKKNDDIKNCRILIIDDNVSIHKDFNKIFTNPPSTEKLDLLESTLFNQSEKDEREKTLFEIDSAFSGKEGLECIRKSVEEKTPYAVAFVDIRMPPGWDGIETVTRILQFEHNIQIIICSAYSDYSWEDMLSKIKNYDRWLLLKKPFDVNDARQMALSLFNKWLLQLEMTKKNKLLENATENLEQTKNLLEYQVNELIHVKDKIKNLAYYDNLTGLPNRFYFKEILNNNLVEANKLKSFVGLFFIDLDDFKKVNKKFGHESGDILLQQISKRLSSLLRNSDSIARHDIDDTSSSITSARLGGDEFTLILTNFKNHKDLSKIARRIIDSVNYPPYYLNNTEVAMNVSIGISVYPTDSKDSNTLIKHAYMAMYQAKEQGKNQFKFYDKILNDSILQKRILEQEIKEGLQKQEFFLLYQPKISIFNNTIIGCEALIRWNHPSKGMLLPDNFIHVAEESNLIINIDQWVIKNVCSQLLKWKQANVLTNKITSINLSATLFAHPDLLNIVEHHIVNHNLDPQTIELEITESMLIESNNKIIKKLNNLRTLLGRGCKVSIDDFGRGYSSLNYLSVFPIDTLKIDQSFIQNASNNDNTKKIIKAIVQLSHSLHLKVIAEGVETKEQFKFLAKIGCDEIQGFYLSQPLPAEKYVDFVKNWDPAKKI